MTPTDPLEARPMVGRPPKGTTVHLQHDHDLRTSLCGEEMPQDKPWELDYLCSFCWAALATPRPAGVDVEWFVEEVVAYYKLYDHHDIWRESGARALGEWLDARAALTVSEEPARE